MAEHPLITAYLDTLSDGLTGRRDGAELRDEMADHLLTSAERSMADGLDAQQAERFALQRFGDPHVVAALLATVPEKGVDMTHVLVRGAGLLCALVAAAWLATIVLAPNGVIDFVDHSWSSTEYLAQSLGLGGTMLLTSLALVALNLRVAARVDSLTGIVIGASVVSTVLSAAMAWAHIVWVPAFAAALAITVARLAPGQRGTTAWTTLVVIAPVLLMIGSFLSLQYLAQDAAAGNPTSLDIAATELFSLIAVSTVSALLALGFGFLAYRTLSGARDVGMPRTDDRPAAVA